MHLSKIAPVAMLPLSLAIPVPIESRHAPDSRLPGAAPVSFLKGSTSALPVMAGPFGGGFSGGAGAGFIGGAAAAGGGVRGGDAIGGAVGGGVLGGDGAVGGFGGGVGDAGRTSYPGTGNPPSAYPKREDVRLIEHPNDSPATCPVEEHPLTIPVDHPFTRPVKKYPETVPVDYPINYPEGGDKNPIYLPKGPTYLKRELHPSSSVTSPVDKYLATVPVDVPVTYPVEKCAVKPSVDLPDTYPKVGDKYPIKLLAELVLPVTYPPKVEEKFLVKLLTEPAYPKREEAYPIAYSSGSHINYLTEKYTVKPLVDLPATYPQGKNKYPIKFPTEPVIPVTYPPKVENKYPVEPVIPVTHPHKIEDKYRITYPEGPTTYPPKVEEKYPTKIPTNPVLPVTYPAKVEDKCLIKAPAESVLPVSYPEHPVTYPPKGEDKYPVAAPTNPILLHAIQSEVGDKHLDDLPVPVVQPEVGDKHLDGLPVPVVQPEVGGKHLDGLPVPVVQPEVGGKHLDGLPVPVVQPAVGDKHLDGLPVPVVQPEVSNQHFDRRSGIHLRSRGEHRLSRRVLDKVDVNTGGVLSKNKGPVLSHNFNDDLKVTDVIIKDTSL